MRIGSLFSGIGGLEKGLEDAGCGSVVWQVERDPFCRSVLAKHWPSALRFDDVCAVGLDNLPPVDIICGGFPCQDLSYAGKGAGLAGERSGLWREYARIVRELRPRFVVVENVSALLARGLGDVLGDLAALGYDAEWHCVRASDVGAPHRRERLFVVAYAAGERRTHTGFAASDQREGGRDESWASCETLADAVGRESERAREPGDVAGEARGAQGEGDERQRVRDAARGSGETLADSHCSRQRQAEGRPGPRGSTEPVGLDQGMADTERERPQGPWGRASGERRQLPANGSGRTRSEPESSLGLATHGLPGRVARWPAGPGEVQHAWEAPRTIGKTDNRAARLKALGNAVVPQVAEVIGGIVMRIAKHAS